MIDCHRNQGTVCFACRQTSPVGIRRRKVGMKHKFLNRFVQICIVLGMLAGIPVIYEIFTYLIPALQAYYGNTGAHSYLGFSCILAVLCVLGAEYIAYTLFCMMRSLEGDPFIQKNVKALRRMGFTALAIAACGFATVLLYPILFAVFVSLPVAMCGLFSLVLSGVFEQAVAYKQENDLTV